MGMSSVDERNRWSVLVEEVTVASDPQIQMMK